MCPRIDIFALSDQMSLEEIIPLILSKGFSRIPVYSEKKIILKEFCTQRLTSALK